MDDRMTKLSAPKDVELWECTGCGSSYFGKPERCENEGRYFWSGLPTGCLYGYTCDSSMQLVAKCVPWRAVWTGGDAKDDR